MVRRLLVAYPYVTVPASSRHFSSSRRHVLISDRLKKENPSFIQALNKLWMMVPPPPPHEEVQSTEFTDLKAHLTWKHPPSHIQKQSLIRIPTLWLVKSTRPGKEELKRWNFPSDRIDFASHNEPLSSHLSLC
ncbi:uncharacterized protein LOC118518185 [Halichoerus grypus]